LEEAVFRGESDALTTEIMSKERIQWLREKLCGPTQMLEQRLEDRQSVLTTEAADNVKIKQDTAALQTTLVTTPRLVAEHDERIRANGSKLEHSTNRLQNAMDEIVQLQSDVSTALEDTDCKTLQIQSRNIFCRSRSRT
jgi:hypothetical protein